MQSLYESLQILGLQSTDAFWFPIGIWTLVALVAFAFLKMLRYLNPIYQYHLRAATLVAVPFGLLVTYLIQFISERFTDSGAFEGAIFVVESSMAMGVTPTPAASFSPNWTEPNFLIGLFTSVVILVSALMLFRLTWSYFSLRNLYHSLSKIPLGEVPGTNSLGLTGVKVAYHDNPLVPFTFGWKQPIIVLPNSIKDDQEKIRMAIQHELVHIKRGDYLLQLILSVIESLFWFHPLVHLGSREIETYREISCDQEVLNVSGVSLKKYASMLYELVPLNRGYGNFSVSMAVQNSTLKKRIETMSYHRIYKTSLKRSLLFLLTMIIAVTVPIACSDLRSPNDLSYEELEQTKLQLEGATLEINGVEATKVAGMGSSGLAAFFINTDDYGIFKISPTAFDGGIQSGEITGNEINFSINEMQGSIKSQSEILTNIDKALVWIEHSPIKFEGKSNGITAADVSISEWTKSSGKVRLNTSIDVDKGDNYFVVVEEMPKLIGGLKGIQSKVVYPEMAKRAGIEGRVTLQFIVNENGDVENPKVIRGIGGGADEAALEVVSQAKFEPGLQRGKPVRVQFSLPVVFRLTDSEFTDVSDNPSHIDKNMKVQILQQDQGIIKVKIQDQNGDPLIGANLSLADGTRISATNSEGIASISNLDEGGYEFNIDYIGYEKGKLYTSIRN